MTSFLITGCNRGIGLGLVKRLLNASKPTKYIFATCRNPAEAKVISTSNHTIFFISAKNHQIPSALPLMKQQMANVRNFLLFATAIETHKKPSHEKFGTKLFDLRLIGAMFIGFSSTFNFHTRRKCSNGNWFVSVGMRTQQPFIRNAAV